ncbi:MAG: hypothetical protein M1819_005717 [Sarea resinae]|nr:MAG: hypothetical protein M1819_005717 [Sarea resinae]
MASEEGRADLASPRDAAGDQETRDATAHEQPLISTAKSGENSGVSDEADEEEDGAIEDQKNPSEQASEGEGQQEPPLPSEPLPSDPSQPPLPDEPPPPSTAAAAEQGEEDDGWQPVWDPAAQAYYFYNRLTGLTQWTNPRVPEASPSIPAGLGPHDRIPTPNVVGADSDDAEGPTLQQQARPRPHGGYDPAIHGDYDPTAPYAQPYEDPSSDAALLAAGIPYLDPSQDPNSADYTATATFNRFTHKFQPAAITPENFNDENKSRRQMNAFFDVDAAANSHDGRSLRAERSAKKLSKKEVKAFREKRREKKEERRRAWLRD